MVHASSIAHAFSADRHAALFRTRLAAHVRPSSERKPPGRSAAGPQVRVRTAALGQVVVPEVAGRLRGVIQNPDQRVHEALRFLRQMTQEGHSNLCVTRRTHDQPRF